LGEFEQVELGRVRRSEILILSSAFEACSVVEPAGAGLVAPSPDVPAQVMLDAVPFVVNRLNKRFTSVTVSGISPGSAGGAVWGLVGASVGLLVVRAWAAVTATTARAAMASTRWRRSAG
jgi:hypothetical protein